MAALRKTYPRRRIAHRLRLLRIRAGVTQEEIAGQLRLRRNQWCRIEAGDQSIPAERLVDIARIISATVDELLGIKKSKTANNQPIGTP
jgi:transcriptional regulator with XRE-family HTH domain